VTPPRGLGAPRSTPRRAPGGRDPGPPVPRAPTDRGGTHPAGPRNGDALHARGVVYAPDYAINAGGLVNVHAEHHGHASGKGYDEKASREKVLAIHDTILEIVERAKATNVPSYRVADLIVEERLAKIPATAAV